MTEKPAPTEETTSQFMHALAAAGVDAANISADRTDDGFAVTTLVATEDVQAAEEVATEYDFDETERGELVDGRETVTYELEA